MFPVLICLSLPSLLIILALLLLDAILLMRTPRNLALSERAFVIKVFSSDSSSLRLSRNLRISSFISFALFLVPQIPMSQSSAYLTYSSRVYWGLGQVDLSFLLATAIFFSVPGEAGDASRAARATLPFFLFRVVWIFRFL